ncbi:uncharacterized protein J3D65DRAFT_399804 [Phyllosticta citribraziliensis]|uniref:Secreted protein n=1 Tax=Phyllosticta citribraziliensis TaxID=989973 RepID=A0ABR1LND6_9PEZI
MIAATAFAFAFAFAFCFGGVWADELKLVRLLVVIHLSLSVCLPVSNSISLPLSIHVARRVVGRQKTSLLSWACVVFLTRVVTSPRSDSLRKRAIKKREREREEKLLRQGIELGAVRNPS